MLLVLSSEIAIILSAIQNAKNEIVQNSSFITCFVWM